MDAPSHQPGRPKTAGDLERNQSYCILLSFVKGRCSLVVAST